VISNGVHSKYWLIGPAWSLAVELQFYIIAPLVAIFIKDKKRALLLFIISALISVFSVFLKLFIGRIDSVILYLPYFLMGGLIYYWDLKGSYKLARLSVLSLILLVALSHSIPEVRLALLDTSGKYTFYGFLVKEVFDCILTIVSLPFIVHNIKQPVKSFEIDSLLSSMSFVVYLLHWPLLQVYSFANQNVGSGLKIFYSILYFVVSICLSFLISKYIDQNFEKSRRSWIKSKKINTVSEVALNR
jgi:peptidoglycan/LPS O-acetylase OafA/YrhL